MGYPFKVPSTEKVYLSPCCFYDTGRSRYCEYCKSRFEDFVIKPAYKEVSQGCYRKIKYKLKIRKILTEKILK